MNGNQSHVFLQGDHVHQPHDGVAQMEVKPARMISDDPERGTAQFGFEGYAKTLADLISYKENPTPFVLGIYGPWGSGKTTLMEAVRTRLSKASASPTQRICKSVWFQAWKYAAEDAMLAALLEEILQSMGREQGVLQRAVSEAKTLPQRSDKKKIIQPRNSNWITKVRASSQGPSRNNRDNWPRRFWSEPRSEERAYREYGSDERRRRSPKASGPAGRPIFGPGQRCSSVTEPRSAPSSRLAPITNLGLPIVPVIS